MNKTIIMVLVFVLLVSNVNAFLSVRSYDVDKNIVTIHEWLGLVDVYSVKLIENTDQCFDCYTIYEFTNLQNKPIPIADFIVKYYDGGLNEISYNGNTWVLVSVNKTIDVPVYKDCQEVSAQYDNKTQSFKEIIIDTQCFVENKKEIITTEQYVPYNLKMEIAPGESVQFKVTGRVNPGGKIDNRINALGYEVAEFSWWNNDWHTCRNVTISYGRAATLYNVSVYVNVTIFPGMQTDLRDVRFISGGCSGSGSELDFEFETNASLTHPAWVRLPSLAQGNTVISLYYNNSNATSGVDETGTWPGYSLVWHMDDTNTSWVGDSTSNNNDGYKTAAANPSVYAPCVIGYCQDFSSDDIQSRYTTGIDATKPFSISAWIHADAFATYHSALEFGDADQSDVQRFYKHQSYANWVLQVTGDNQTTAAADTNLHLVMITYKPSNNYTAYLDGVIIKNWFKTATFDDMSVLVGGTYWDVYWWDGKIDEVRLKNTLISQSQHWFEWQNIVNYTGVVAMGAPNYPTTEPPTGNSTPTMRQVTISPLNGNISTDIDCYANATDSMNTTIQFEAAWYEDGVLFSVTNHTDKTAGALSYLLTLSNANLDNGEVWTCAVRAISNGVWSSWLNTSTTITDVTDSCTPPAINNDWTVDLSDSCVLETGTRLGTGKLILTGDGMLTVKDVTLQAAELIKQCSTCGLSITNGMVAIG